MPGAALSIKMTDSPGSMLVIPFRATDAAKEPELSSILQPVMSATKAVLFVTSNQSAARGLLPLDHGATSEMNNRPMVPGEPISVFPEVSRTEKALLVPTTLDVEIVVLFNNAALLNVGSCVGAGDAPKMILACKTPSAL